MRNKAYSILLFAGILAILAMGVANAEPETIYVPDNFPTIQAAVDAANPGDTLVVRDGTYTENVNVNKDHLTIRSENGADVTIVQVANPNDHIFEVTANYVDISGFNITKATGSGKAGIYLARTTHCHISDNIIRHNYYAVYLHSSNDNTITDNMVTIIVVPPSGTAFYGNPYGIYLYSSTNNVVTNNIISGGSHCLIDGNKSGIDLYVSHNNILSNNTVSGIIPSDLSAPSDEAGICLRSSNNNTLANSSVSSSILGISIDSSSSNILQYNEMFNNVCNFSLEGSSNNDFNNSVDTSNTVDGKPVYYIQDATNQVYDNSANAGTVYCINCDNVTVKDLTLTKNAYGVFFYNTHNSRIENVTTSNNQYGIYLELSNNNVLNSNICQSNNFSGIYLRSCGGNTLNYNTANSNRQGICLNTSDDNILTENIANGNGNLNEKGGIYLRYANRNVLNNNNVSSNTRGIYLYFSNNNTLTDNSISDNWSALYGFSVPPILAPNDGLGVGLYLYYSSENVLTSNVFLANSWGIQLSSANNNKIYQNNFIDNIFEGDGYKLQAYVSGGSSNLFDNGYPSGGNYWSDYVGEDLYSGLNQDHPGSDRIGDTPYYFEGGQDNYPLTMPFENYLPAPSPPINLSQLKSDDQTEIPIGATTNEPTVVFRADVNDPDGDRVKLQIELRRLNEYEGKFLNEFTKESDFVTSGSEATVTVYGLIDGNYHWQARAVDEKGLASEWVQFGNNDISGTDFIVTSQNQPLRPVNISPADADIDVSLEPMLRSSPPLQGVDKDSIPWEEINGLLVTRIDSQWQITTVRADYSYPVWNNTLTDGLIDRRFFPDLPEAWANFIPSGVLDYETTYYWRVRYQDFRGVWSPWSEETSFTTRQFRPPVADFSYDPEPPKVRQWVTLNASYSRGGDGEIIVYEWDLNGDGDFDGFTSSPKIYYYWDEDGEYDVTLRVTTDEGAVDTCTNTVYVEKSPWWEKIKGLFASDVVTLSKEEKDRFYRIIFELGIGKGTDDLDYWTDNQLLTVLKNKIDPQAGDITYETLILDTLHDMKLADSVASRSFTPNPVIENYFKNMAEVNVWAETGLLITEEVFTGLIEAAGGSSIGVGVILMLPDLCQAGVGIEFLDQVFYRKALWYYFQNREMGDSPEVAFGSSPIPIKYDNETTNEYFETLWTEYGAGHMSSSGGLKEDFKNQIIRQLRRLLLSGREKYKFAPYKLYIIKSPVTVRVYDSQGRITGLLNGEVREEIPNSAYDEESKTILIFDSNDSYRYEAIGTNEGTYGLDIVSLKGGEATGFTATDIPTSPNAVHQYTADWEALSQGKAGVTLLIDAEGDGIFERTIISDNKLTPCEIAIEPVGYELISQKKISETESEYIFRLVAKNTGKHDVKNITLKLASEPNGTSIIDSVVYFSTIQAGEQLLSDDTFTVRSDKSQDVLESELIWQVCKCIERPKSDFSHDWMVSLADLAKFTDQWLNSCSEPNWCQGTDLDQSNLVNFIDFATFAQNWLWEIIPADFNINGEVEFTDYAVLANQWRAGNCAESAWCDGADLNKSGSVDLFDLAEFAEHWLEGITP
jgi:parallel beta-helix repeat protein